MQVWEERYTNNKGKKESKRTFDIFQIYDNLPLPRDIKELTRIIYFPNQKLQDIYFIITILKQEQHSTITTRTGKSMKH